MLERIKPEKTVEVYGHVTLMRSQRNYMVQTKDQFSFIHWRCWRPWAVATPRASHSLYTYIQKLGQAEPGEQVTGMDLEFKVAPPTPLAPPHPDHQPSLLAPPSPGWVVQALPRPDQQPRPCASWPH